MGFFRELMSTFYRGGNRYFPVRAVRGLVVAYSPFLIWAPDYEEDYWWEMCPTIWELLEKGIPS